MNYKILDNALNENSFQDLQKYFFSSDMTWYYNNTTIDNEVDESYYFSHWMYKEHQIKSNMFESVYNLFNPILDLRSIFSIRANLTLKRENKLFTSWHTDVEPYSLFNGEFVNFKTAIFYLNTNDGSTFSGQIIGALTIFVWVFVVSLVAWGIIKAVMGIRVTEEEEYEGVDISECGMEAYPEFVTSRK